MSNIDIRLPEYKHQIQKKMTEFVFSESSCREMWIACGTKTGKTFGGAIAILHALFHHTQSINRWVAPIYSQSKIGYRYCSKFLPKEIKGRDGKRIKLPVQSSESPTPLIRHTQKDSRLEFWHANDPESLEGEGTKFNVFDEAAKYRNGDEVYSSVKTTCTKTQGKILALSTPLGRSNWFYKRWKKAREIMLYELKNGLPITAIALQAPSYINPTISVEVFKDMFKKMPLRLFEQYVEAKFLDFSGIFENIIPCTDYSEIVIIGLDESFFYLHSSSKMRDRVVIGVDWGKKTDYTVFTAIRCHESVARVVGLMRFRRISYKHAITKLKEFIDCFDEVMSSTHDQTGVGEALDDHMDDIDISGEVFTNANKNDWVNNLILAFQEKKILIPDCFILRDELDAYIMKITSTGKFAFMADPLSGKHDDMISSLLLTYNNYLNSEQLYEVTSIDTTPETLNVLDPSLPFFGYDDDY